MTITSSREIDTVFRDGKRYATPVLTALVNKTHEERGPQGRVAFIAGKKLGNAVLRNRSKRVMREAVRRAGGPWRGADVLLIARSTTGSIGAAELDSALSEITRRAGLGAQ